MSDLPLYPNKKDPFILTSTHRSKLFLSVGLALIAGLLIGLILARVIDHNKLTSPPNVAALCEQL